MNKTDHSVDIYNSIDVSNMNSKVRNWAQQLLNNRITTKSDPSVLRKAMLNILNKESFSQKERDSFGFGNINSFVEEDVDIYSVFQVLWNYLHLLENSQE
jgi:hypothetical protein